MRITYRAGTNLKEDPKSGYARVDVLSNHDYYPEQGHVFKEKSMKKTNTTITSEDSSFFPSNSPMIVPSEEDKEFRDIITGKPFNRNRSVDQPGNRNYGPIGSRRARLQANKDKCYKVRKEQVIEKERLKLARQKDDRYWTNQERKLTADTEDFWETSRADRKATQNSLRECYEEQFLFKEEQKKEELRQGEMELAELQKAKNEEDEKLRIRTARRKKYQDEAKAEFKIANEKLLTRKARRIQEEIEENKKYDKQNEENIIRQLERKKFEEARQEEKNKIRNYLIERETKKLALMKKEDEDKILPSEVERRNEERRALEREKRQCTADGRKGDYARMLRNKTLMRMNLKEPHSAPTLGATDPERDFDAQVKHQTRRQLLDFQIKQMVDRQNKEKTEHDTDFYTPGNAFFLGPDAF